MIRRLHVQGLGPHKDTSLGLDPKGQTTITGPSESGKSTALDALTWCLWGVTASGKKGIHPAWLRAGCDEVEVSIELGSGTKLSRSATKKTERRSKNSEEIATEAAWRDALGPLGKSPELLRVILAPLAWVPLANGAGGGREFRDLLAAVLGSGDIRPVVAELADVRDGDSLIEAEAYARRSDANKRRDELRGRMEAATEEAERASVDTVEPPSADDMKAANALLELGAAWGRYKLGEATSTWAAAVRDLGPRPDVAEWEATVGKRRETRDEAATKVAELRRRLGDAEAEHRNWRADATEYEAAKRAEVAAADVLTKRRAAGSKCAECGQAIPNARDLLREAEEAATTAAQSAEGLRTALHKAEGAGKTERLSAVNVIKADVQLAGEALKRATNGLETALAKNPAAEWDAARKALGDRPAHEPAVHPVGKRPESEALAGAREVLAAVDRAAGAQRGLEAARQRAVAAAERIAKDLEAATAEAVRLDKLVDAIRRAPSIVAARQVAELGDLGPVAVEFPKDGRAIEILVDGRPWWTASRGRLVVADLHLRAALRRAVKLPWLGLWVDNADAWTGAWPEIGGPVVFLKTAPVAALEVRS